MSNWTNWRCESCNKGECICRDCSYSYTSINDIRECRCRLPYKRECPNKKGE